MYYPIVDRRIFLVSESLEFSKTLDNNDHFWKVPIIYGPGKLSPFTLKIEFNSFASSIKHKLIQRVYC